MFSGGRRLLLRVVFRRARRQGPQGDRLGPVLQLRAPEPDQRHVLRLIDLLLCIAWPGLAWLGIGPSVSPGAHVLRDGLFFVGLRRSFC